MPCSDSRLPSCSQIEETYQRNIQDGVGETAKNESNISKARKERIKSEAKLKQRVQEMKKYAPIYRSEMQLEFQRCQEEELGKVVEKNTRRK